MDIKEHMKVVGKDGGHIGTVDRVEDGRIKLTKSDSSDQKHRFIGPELIESVEGDTVMLSLPANDVPKQQG
jgi:hypothetical protein